MRTQVHAARLGAGSQPSLSSCFNAILGRHVLPFLFAIGICDAICSFHHVCRPRIRMLGVVARSREAWIIEEHLIAVKDIIMHLVMSHPSCGRSHKVEDCVQATEGTGNLAYASSVFPSPCLDRSLITSPQFLCQQST